MLVLSVLRASDNVKDCQKFIKNKEENTIHGDNCKHSKNKFLFLK